MKCITILALFLPAALGMIAPTGTGDLLGWNPCYPQPVDPNRPCLPQNSPCNPRVRQCCFGLACVPRAANSYSCQAQFPGNVFPPVLS